MAGARTTCSTLPCTCKEVEDEEVVEEEEAKEEEAEVGDEDGTGGASVEAARSGSFLSSQLGLEEWPASTKAKGSPKLGPTVVSFKVSYSFQSAKKEEEEEATCLADCYCVLVSPDDGTLQKARRAKAQQLPLPPSTEC